MDRDTGYLPPRRSAAVAVIAVLLAAALSACAQSPPAGSPSASSSSGGTQSSDGTQPSTGSPPTTTPPAGGSSTGTPPRSTTLTVTRTGGIAGVRQQVEIAPDGSWTYTDQRTGRVEHGQLDAGQRQELARLAADPALAAEARQKPPYVCNDAFVYAVTIGELAVRYEQCGASTNQPRVKALVSLVTAATPL